MRLLALTCVVVAAAPALPAAAAARAAAIRVAMTDHGFRFSRTSVRRGTTVVFTIRNVGTKPHNVDVVGVGRSAIIQPGRSTKLRVVFRRAGRYQVVSDVPGQLQHGLVAVFRVT